MLKTILIFNLFLGTVFADSSRPMSYSQVVSIWPDGSKVLADGIKKIEETKGSTDDPALIITHPTFLLYSPKTHSARSAVIVFPGGGYKGVAIGEDSTLGLNGADVCRWLTDAGVTCVLLKYRVPNTGCHWDKKTSQNVTPDIPMALQDAQRTISIVRYNAKKYDIDPNKIGVMGFSAGGNMAVLSSTAFKKRSYNPIDEIDRVSPGGHLKFPHLWPGKIPQATGRQVLR